MKMNTITTSIDFDQQFAQDIIEGFSQTPKRLSSKYFYDEKGDKLFQDIMNMPEYYLTNSEYEILDTYKKQLSGLWGSQSFDLIELGAGDGYKTKLLLQQFLEDSLDFRYVPIDISQNALSLLESDLNINMPRLNVEGQQGDYFEVLSSFKQFQRPKIVLFLGANIGNFSIKQAQAFFSRLAQNLNPQDQVFIGIDLKKAPQTILDAYNDPAGITSDFNLNLLDRINHTFEGNFNRDAFQHWETYNPITGEAKSYIISKIAQTIDLKCLGYQVKFKAWEAIHVEISKKYDLLEVDNLAQTAGFCVKRNFFDKQNYFVNSLWQLK